VRPPAEEALEDAAEADEAEDGDEAVLTALGEEGGDGGVKITVGTDTEVAVGLGAEEPLEVVETAAVLEGGVEDREATAAGGDDGEVVGERLTTTESGDGVEVALDGGESAGGMMAVTASRSAALAAARARMAVSAVALLGGARETRRGTMAAITSSSEASFFSRALIAASERADRGSGRDHAMRVRWDAGVPRGGKSAGARGVAWPAAAARRLGRMTWRSDDTSEQSEEGWLPLQWRQVGMRSGGHLPSPMRWAPAQRPQRGGAVQAERTWAGDSQFQHTDFSGRRRAKMIGSGSAGHGREASTCAG
jgi:hypothetical protein